MITESILYFRDKYYFLSNFYNSLIIEDGLTYPTMEHYFQAQKTTDRMWRIVISGTATPGIAKRYGRKVELRADWEQIKDKVMYKGLLQKFTDPNLRKQLLDTGNA